MGEFELFCCHVSASGVSSGEMYGGVMVYGLGWVVGRGYDAWMIGMFGWLWKYLGGVAMWDE